MYSVILVDYKSMEKTVKYIDAFISSVDGMSDVKFIIIDNSPASSSEYIVRYYGEFKKQTYKKWELYEVEKQGHRIVYCHAKANLGYARANNLGFEIADALYKAEYYLVSNNDILLPEKLDLEILAANFERDNNIAVVGPRVIGADGNEQNPRKDISAFKSLVLTYWCAATYALHKRIISGVDYTGESKKCYWVSGCFMLMHAKRIRKCGCFDEKTFLYAEEMILAERLKAQGYYMYFENGLQIVHEESSVVNHNMAFIKRAETMFKSKLYYYIQYRNLSKGMEFFAKANFAMLKTLYRIVQSIGGKK